MSSKPVVGYWDIRGLAQPIRLLLTYVGVDFEDKRYQYGPAPTFDRSDWLNVKFNLGLDFPNLPYYMEGDVKMTQTLAIMRYLARKHKLEGQTEQEKIRASLCEQQTIDMLVAMARISYDSNFEKLKPDYMQNLPGSLKLMSTFLGDHPFVAGTNLTYVDFLLYEYLCRIKVLTPDVFQQYDNLQNYVKRFESLPQISNYIKQQEPKPFNGAMAKWNDKY